MPKESESINISEEDIIIGVDEIFSDTRSDTEKLKRNKETLKNKKDKRRELIEDYQSRLGVESIEDEGFSGIPSDDSVPASLIVSTPINVQPGSVLNKAIANPAENDALLGIIRDNKPVSTIFRAIMEEIAEEAAYIKAWRNENWSCFSCSRKMRCRRIC
jgi:hypothetical protein